MGVVTRQAIVVIAVIAMDSTMFPFAKYVNIFETVPPGMAASKASPIRTPMAASKNDMKRKATSGTKSSCIPMPMVKARGVLIIPLKSFGVSVAPIPSIARLSCAAANQYSWAK